MTTFLVIALVVLTFICIALALVAGYGVALKDRADRKREAIRAISEFIDFAKGFTRWLEDYKPDNEPESEPAKKEPDGDPDPANVEKHENKD